MSIAHRPSPSSESYSHWSQHSPTPSLQPGPRELVAKFTDFFKRHEKVCMDFILQDEVNQHHEQNPILQASSSKPSTSSPSIVVQSPDETASRTRTDSAPKADPPKVFSWLCPVFGLTPDLNKPGNLVQPTRYNRRHDRKCSSGIRKASHF